MKDLVHSFSHFLGESCLGARPQSHMNLKGALFRGSGLAPTTQDWAAGLRGQGGPPPAVPKRATKSPPRVVARATSTSNAKVSMLSLATTARLWRREQKQDLINAFRRWRRRAKRSRQLLAVSPRQPPTARKSLEFRLQVEAHTVVRAFLLWRHWVLAAANLREVLQLVQPHLARKRQARIARMLMGRWRTSMQAAAREEQARWLAHWRATYRKHRERQAALEATARTVGQRLGRSATFTTLGRFRAALQQWASWRVQVALMHGAIHLGTLAAASMAWRRALGHWRQATAYKLVAEHLRQLAEHSAALVRRRNGLTRLRTASSLGGPARWLGRVRKERRLYDALRQLRDHGFRERALLRAESRTMVSVARARRRQVHVAMRRWVQQWQQLAKGDDAVTRYARLLARRLPRRGLLAECHAMSDVLGCSLLLT